MMKASLTTLPAPSIWEPIFSLTFIPLIKKEWVVKHTLSVWQPRNNSTGQYNRKGARAALPFRYPGQYEDAETGLYYNRFRYYDPQLAPTSPKTLLG